MIWRLFSLIAAGLLSISSTVVHSDVVGIAALKEYYSSLENVLSDYSQHDIPFSVASISVEKNNSLVQIAQDIKFDELDLLHLASAIYVNNSGAFRNNDASNLIAGSILKLPSVGDLYLARYEFERVSINGRSVDFNASRNVMRDGLRYPFELKQRPDVVWELGAVASNNTNANIPANAVVWDVSLWGKPRASTLHVEKLAELVAERTNNSFRLNINYRNPSKARGNLDGIAAGTFEMAQFCAGYDQDKTPTLTVLELPFLGIESMEEDRWVSQWLYRHPAVRDDLARWNAIALMPSPLPPHNLVGIGDSPNTIIDLQGLRVGTTGEVGAAIAAVNGEEIRLIEGDVRQALNLGNVDAVAFAPHTHIKENSTESADWWTTNLNLGNVHCPVVANIDAIGSLTNEHLDALYSSINDALDFYIASYNSNLNKSWANALNGQAVDRVTFGKAELDLIRVQFGKESASEWIQSADVKQLPGRELYDLVAIALTGRNPETLNQLSKLLSDVESPPIQSELTLFPDPSKAAFKTAFVAKRKHENKRLALERSQAAAAAKANPDLLQTELLPIESDSGRAPVYLGPPRGDTGSTALSADPLSYPIEWELGRGVTVGRVMAELTDYIGYILVIDNSSVNAAYERSLPGVHRNVSGITVGEAFEILAGQGYITAVDHIDRSIKHIPKNSGVTILSPDLPKCPNNVRNSAEISTGVYRLYDGTECVI